MTDDENRVAALRAKRDRERLRWEREACDWTDAEIAEHVADRYVPPVVPPCRVCGEPLSITSAGSGPTWWACSGMEADPDNDSMLRWMEGRSCADEHYMHSRWEDRRAGGDDAVVELLRRFQAERTTRDAVVAAAVGAETLRCIAVCDDACTKNDKHWTKSAHTAVKACCWWMRPTAKETQ